MHELLNAVEKAAQSAVTTVEALASKSVGPTDNTGKKGLAVQIATKLVDAFLESHGLAFAEATVNGLIEHGIEAALEALSHAGGIGAILADVLN